MWVDFVVGSCFTLREMSGVAVLQKSLGRRFVFSRGHVNGGVREDIGKMLCVSKMLWSFCQEEVLSLKKFSYVQENRKVKTSKHQETSLLLRLLTATEHLPNSERTLSLSLRALKPYIRDEKKDEPFASEIWERKFFRRG